MSDLDAFLVRSKQHQERLEEAVARIESFLARLEKLLLEKGTSK